MPSPRAFSSCGFVSNQVDFSILNAVRIKRADIPACALPGGYLEIDIQWVAVPAGGRTIFESDLYDSEPGY